MGRPQNIFSTCQTWICMVVWWGFPLFSLKLQHYSLLVLHSPHIRSSDVLILDVILCHGSGQTCISEIAGSNRSLCTTETYLPGKRTIVFLLRGDPLLLLPQHCIQRLPFLFINKFVCQWNHCEIKITIYFVVELDKNITWHG